MQKPELELHEPSAPWKQVDPHESAGIWEQTLSCDPSGRYRTMLQRYEPNGATNGGKFTHNYWEEILIISGEITDQTLGTTFTSGMYACRPPGMPHGPYHSTTGCQMIIFIHP